MIPKPKILIVTIFLFIILGIKFPLIWGKENYMNKINKMINKMITEQIEYFSKMDDKEIEKLEKEIKIEIENLLKKLENRNKRDKIGKIILELRNIVDNRTIINIYLKQKRLPKYKKDKLKLIAKLYSVKDDEIEKIICDDLLRDKNSYVRLESATILGILKRKSSVSCLVNKLFDEDELVRRHVIESLAEIAGVDL